MPYNKPISKKLKEKICEMTDMGVPDVEIAKKINYSRATISKITTKYWKEKFKSNNE